MSATDSYTILRETEGVQPLAKGHTEKMNLRKNLNPPALCCSCASLVLASSEAERQEGRYWLLLPLGNTGDRLKSRGKKLFHS